MDFDFLVVDARVSSTDFEDFSVSVADNNDVRELKVSYVIEVSANDKRERKPIEDRQKGNKGIIWRG